MDRDRPHRLDPIRKMTIATMKSAFLPCMSESLPYSGVVAAFCRALLERRAVRIDGDGGQGRDFTYVEDVVGCAVSDENGRPLGIVKGTFWNGAHDVCTVIDSDGRDHLLPLVPEFVLEVDTAGRKMRVRRIDDD